MRGLTPDEYRELALEAAHGCDGEIDTVGPEEDALIDRLRDRGLVERCGCDPDPDVECFRITPLGREAMRIHEALAATVSP